jgi:polygalacturonase
MGGIRADDLTDVTISFDGTIVFSDDMDEWPRNGDGSVFPCLLFNNPTNVVWTSSGKGLLDGKGKKWWGFPGIGYLQHGENRPRLIESNGGTNLLVENIIMKDSPYWTFWFVSSRLHRNPKHASLRREPRQPQREPKRPAP